MTLLLRSALLVLLLAMPALGQWASGGTTGGKNRVSSGFDTTEFAAATVIELNEAKTKVRMIDTTVTSTSVSRIVAFNLHDPNQLGRYNANGELVSAFDQFRTAELNGSIWRTEGLLFPTQGWLIATDGGDTLEVWDGLSVAKRMFFKVGVNQALEGLAVTDVSFKDGSIYTVGYATGGGSRISTINLTFDEAELIVTSGKYQYNGRLTSRNSSSGISLVSATTAIIGDTVYNVVAMRSMFAGLAGVDQFGWQRPYWVIGTDAGPSATIYNSAGTLSIYDGTSTNDWTALTSVGSGLVGVVSDATRDNIVWRYAPTAITADAWAVDETWANNGSGSEDLRWPNATIITDVGALAGASGSGLNSPRIYAASDSGLYILDAMANDNTNGCKREITNGYVSLTLCGNVVLGWSGGSSANIVDRSAPFTTAGTPTFSTQSGSPTGAQMLVESSSEDISREHGSGLNLGTANWTITVWVKLFGDLAGNVDIFTLSGGTDFLLMRTVDASSDQMVLIITDDTYATTDQINATTNVDDDKWHRYDWVRSGSVVYAYVDGLLVASGSITNAAASLDPSGIVIGGSANEVADAYGGFVLTKTALSAATIAEAYASDLRYINSSFPDTLYSTKQHRVKTNPITSQFLLMDTTRTTSVVEIRDKHGALIDTLVCTACGRGRDADFLHVPGIDSTSIFIGGTLGFRVVTPDPRVVALAQASWPTHGARYIGSGPAIVDSSGYGDFWTLDDAVAAVNNVGQNLVQVLRGTYPAATVPQDGMTVEGAGDTLTVFDGLVAAAGLTVSGADVTVRKIGLRSTPGGGGSADGLSVTGARFIGESIRVMGADDDCISLTGTSPYLVDFKAHRCDDEGVLMATDNALLIGRVQDQSGTSILISAGSENNVIQARTDGVINDAGSGNTIVSEETAY